MVIEGKQTWEVAQPQISTAFPFPSVQLSVSVRNNGITCFEAYTDIHLLTTVLGSFATRWSCEFSLSKTKLVPPVDTRRPDYFVLPSSR